MPVKLLAFLVLAGVGWTAGGEAAKTRTERYRRLCGVILLLHEMNDGIRFARTGLCEIIASFHNESLEKCGFLECFSSSSFVPLELSWKTGVEKLDINEEASSSLLSLGEGLGRTDLETQTERIELCLSRLARIRDEEGAGLAKKVKSYRMLGLLASVAAAIILY